MDSNLAGLCSDFYINQKIALTMDVPEGRESVLDLFGRIQKEFQRKAPSQPLALPPSVAQSAPDSSCNAGTLHSARTTACFF